MKRIVVLKYGESIYNEKYIFAGGAPDVMLPISFVIYLIQDGNRNILVDAGCNDGAGFKMSCFCKPIEVLEKYGLRPEDITDVILTHRHHDHVEAIGDFKDAVIHIQKEEYAPARKFIPENSKVEIFEEQTSLGPNLTIRKIGGHSTGSSIVIYEADNKKYVFCGDECYVRECFEKQIPTGATCNPALSKQFIQDYNGKEYIPLLFHDPTIIPGKVGYEIIMEDPGIE